MPGNSQIHAQVQRDIERGTHTIVITVPDHAMIGGNIDLTEALGEAAKEMAADWLKENQGQVLKHLDPVAVANLAIAESAQLVRTKFIDPKAKKEKE